MKRKPEPTKERLKPISLHPLTPEEALRAFLEVKPEEQPAPVLRTNDIRDDEMGREEVEDSEPDLK